MRDQDVMPDNVTHGPWDALRKLTPARIGLGHTGTSLPTQAQLDFQFAHAQARDAVHLPFEHAELADSLEETALERLLLHSAASDRHIYLQRPDLGRKLDDASAASLDAHAAGRSEPYDLAIVVADGLSALAIHRHAKPFIERLLALIEDENWALAPITLVQQGRVAVADEIGARLGARMTVILIGERPGLSSPDSLGLYFTFAPKVGLNDAYRNCISNVRLEGQSYAMAAHRLHHLMREACRRQLSGVKLKDDADMQTLASESGQMLDNFLLPDNPRT